MRKFGRKAAQIFAVVGLSALVAGCATLFGKEEASGSAPAETAEAAESRDVSPTATRSLRASTNALNVAIPNELRLLMLERGSRESDRAVFYGYVLVGPDVAPERKGAVAKALACRIDAVTGVEEAEAIDLLGVITLPSRAAASGEVIVPAEILQNYDYPRSRRWLAAAGDYIGEEFDLSTAIVFIGSRSARSGELDRQMLLGDENDPADPMIADASELSPRYLERWFFEVMQSVQAGELQSRQDMQGLMEAHSWIEFVGQPFAALMKLVPPATAQDFSAPPCT